MFTRLPCQRLPRLPAAWTLLALFCAGIIGGDSQPYHREPLYLAPPQASRPAERPTTLFGYSIAYLGLSKGQHTVLVGAPRAGVDGKLHSCQLTANLDGYANNTFCNDLPIRPKKMPDKYNNRNTKYSFVDHEPWLGATIAVFNEHKFATCAPRWFRRAKNDTYGVTGICFTYDTKEIIKSSKVIPKDDSRACQICKRTSGNSGGFGWSLAATKPKNRNRTNLDMLYIGGPAVCTSGSYYSHEMFNLDKKTLHVSLNIFNMSCEDNPPVLPTINFGYAMTSGMFMTDGETVAVSSLYGEHGYGTVSIMKDSSELIRLKDKIPGSMFGAALCGINLNGDVHTDLLVGAPSYASDKESREQGAVFIYLGGPNVSHVIVKLLGDKNKPRSYFGDTIANLGDLDGDGRDEFAISAPYEDDLGSVYLYASLAYDELHYRYWQRISPGVRGFGASIIALPDIDMNGCNEMAVGATDSDTVLVLRCQPVITVNIVSDLKKMKLDRLSMLPINSTSFKFESCIDVNYPMNANKISGNLLVKTEFSHSAARLRDRTYEINLNGSISSPICRMIEVYTDLPFIINKMNIYMEVNILNKCFEGNYDPSCVVLSSRNKLAYNATLVTHRGCGEECDPKLELKMSVKGNENSNKLLLEIGSTDKVAVRIRVNNRADSAYNWCMKFRVDGAPSEPPPNGGCSQTGPNQYLCKPAPLFSREYIDLNVVIFTEELTTNNQTVVVTASVNDKCKGKEKKVEQYHLDLFALPKFIVLKSLSGQDVVNLDQAEYNENTTFEHIYLLRNDGPSTWLNIEVKISTAMYTFLQFGCPLCDGITCSDLHRNTSEDSLIIIFLIQSIKSYSSISIGIPLVVMHNNVGSGLENQVNITTFAEISSARFIRTDQGKSAQLNTTLLIPSGFKLWHYLIIAVVASLVLLTLLTLILRKKGFFGRKTKKKLQQLKRESKMCSQRASARVTSAQPAETL